MLYSEKWVKNPECNGNQLTLNLLTFLQRKAYSKVSDLDVPFFTLKELLKFYNTTKKILKNSVSPKRGHSQMQVSGSKTKSFCLIFQVDRIQNDVQFLVNFNPVPLFFLKIVFTPLPPGKSNLILVIWRQKKDLAPQALWQQVMQCFQRKGKRHQFGDKSYYLVILEGNHHKFASVRGWKKKPLLTWKSFEMFPSRGL